MNHSARSSNTRRSIRSGKRAIALAIVGSFLLVLPSCGIPHLRPPLPGQPLPPDDKPADIAENSAQVTIEEFFNDPILTNLIYQSLAGNQELKILNEDIQIAGNDVLMRQGTYLPFLSLAALAGGDKISSFTVEGAGLRDDPFRPGQLIPNPHGNFLLGANITWQIDVWRQLRNARDASVLRYFGTGEGRNYLVTRLVAEIAENYYTLMALDARLDNINTIIDLQQKSLQFAEKMKAGARGTELPVQRFRAEVRKNESERFIVRQDIIQVENRINFLLGRFPQPVERKNTDFIDMNMHSLNVGVPSQLLLYRPDIRQAERELEAAGLDVKVARARFLPVVAITAGVGYEAFNPTYLFLNPEALIANIAGNLVAPLINRRAIKADYMTANAKQLQSLYNYQRVILNAFTEVVNRVTMVENYRRSIQLKKQQVQSLNASVDAATRLFQNARAEYIDVLFAQRDLFDARRVLIDTKREQLSALVNAYQALGGGNLAPNFDWKRPHASHWEHLQPKHNFGPPPYDPKPGAKPLVAPQPLPEFGGAPAPASPIPDPPASSGPFAAPGAAPATTNGAPPANDGAPPLNNGVPPLSNGAPPASEGTPPASNGAPPAASAASPGPK